MIENHYQNKVRTRSGHPAGIQFGNPNRPGDDRLGKAARRCDFAKRIAWKSPRRCAIFKRIRLGDLIKKVNRLANRLGEIA